MHRPILRELEQYLLSLGYRPKSASGISWQAGWFLWWLGDREVQMVSAKDLRAYRQYLKTRPSKNGAAHLSEKTIYGYERSVRLLFDYLLETGQISYDPCSEWRVVYPSASSQRMALSQAEIKQLYAACETIRERLILALAYGCGLRASELEMLDLGDVNLAERKLVVRRGKNGKRRLIPLSVGVAGELARRVKGDKYGPFLLHDRGGRMRAYTANKRLKAVAKRTGIKSQISLHVLRHSIATHLLENGLGLDQVRLFLGHRKAATTEVYTHIGTSQLRRLLA
ncbi:MAG: tyrosine-type recombinase/integrase [Bacteroidota bacterium]